MGWRGIGGRRVRKRDVEGEFCCVRAKFVPCTCKIRFYLSSKKIHFMYICLCGSFPAAL